MLYNFIVSIYFLAIRLAAVWNPRAAAFVAGRKNWYLKLKQQIVPGEKYIWVHCSSAGEFEQGKPVVEALKKQFATHKILISFFSPSGFAAAKNYPFADAVCYLPFDSRKNAELFVQLLQPELVLFVKYEFWYHHLKAAAFRHIPLLLISASFRPEQIFFQWHGKFYRQMLFLFRHIFVQNQSSLQLLQQHGIRHASISGDTRFDRVVSVAAQQTALPAIESFISGAPVMVAGSTWPDDEKLLAEFLLKNPGVKLILAPHEISPRHLRDLELLFPQAIKYSQVKNVVEGKPEGSGIWQQIQSDENLAWTEKLKAARVLIIDAMGLLSRLYRYATLVWIGGGFTKDGIHNSLEAAVYAKPVFFGPNFKKYPEAAGLIEAGSAFSMKNAEELQAKTTALLNDEKKLYETCSRAGQFVLTHTGATETILQFIQEKRLLTS